MPWCCIPGESLRDELLVLSQDKTPQMESEVDSLAVRYAGALNVITGKMVSVDLLRKEDLALTI